MMYHTIKGYENYGISKSGDVFTGFHNKVLKQHLNKYGRPFVILTNAGKRKTIEIHRLVALRFIPNPNNYTDVNHIDGNKKNNDTTNLEWCTRSYNLKHAYDTGLKISLKGEDSGRSKLTEKDVLSIRSECNNSTYKELANKYEVSISNIYFIISGKSWKHI